DIYKSILSIITILYRLVTLVELIYIIELLSEVSNNLVVLTSIIEYCSSFLTIREDYVYFIY
ncbi:hypothetical protein DOTSEDRAFT_139618, partial [Dothistroma septosporum NZE10]